MFVMRRKPGQLLKITHRSGDAFQIWFHQGTKPGDPPIVLRYEIDQERFHVDRFTGGTVDLLHNPINGQDALVTHIWSGVTLEVVSVRADFHEICVGFRNAADFTIQRAEKLQLPLDNGPGSRGAFGLSVLGVTTRTVMA